MDCLVEGFLELFGEGFVYLCSAFVPNKNISERAHRIIGIVVLFVSLALFVGLIVGIFLLVVAVNEQNPLAKGFYEHMGFEVYKRTECDEQGNPYPLLYMRLD